MAIVTSTLLIPVGRTYEIFQYLNTSGERRGKNEELLGETDAEILIPLAIPIS